MEDVEEKLLSSDKAPDTTNAKNGVAQTALLIIANCAGAGILSLPKAMNQAGLIAGTVLVVAAAILSAYTADILGRCYNIIQQQEQDGIQAPDSSISVGVGDTVRVRDYEDGTDCIATIERETSCATYDVQYSDGTKGLGVRAAQIDEHAQLDVQTSFFARSPYAAIGQKAAGSLGAGAVTCAQVMTQFCVMVLFFLISGVNLNKLIPQRSSLFFSFVCTAALAPFMLLRPGHVWGTAIFAILASVILVVVVIFLCATDAPHDPYTKPPEVTFSTFGTAFGVILFGFGGHAILPALQATMANPTPSRFRQAVVGSFAVCTAMYLSTSIGAVQTLGGTVSDDILKNFSGSVNNFGLVAVTLHLLFAAITVHIPLGQIMDHYAGASDFSARQVAIRAVTMGAVAASIWVIGSNFFCVIGLVGGTCNNAMIFIFPPWFYLKLMSPEERTPLTVVKMSGIMLVGTGGMVSALVGAVEGC